ncbi:hypothetical protein K474DRAFT_1608898 [Panus rudis PR-1116 ss-1]|nr:hypothetical protein K474DRAFT_1608898 [Panus rudis PR-1116 ss-1]
MQRPYKLAIKRSQLQDIVNETLEHLHSGAEATQLRLDNTIGTLRDRSVSWFLNAFRDINDPLLIKKAFERCVVRGGFNLSFESIKSRAANEIIRDLPRTDPTLWNKVSADYAPDGPIVYDENADLGNDTALEPADLMLSILSPPQRDLGTDVSAPGAADELEPGEMVVPEADPTAEENLGRGKRHKMATSRYTKDFGMH